MGCGASTDATNKGTFKPNRPESTESAKARRLAMHPSATANAFDAALNQQRTSPTTQANLPVRPVTQQPASTDVSLFSAQQQPTAATAHSPPNHTDTVPDDDGVPPNDVLVTNNVAHETGRLGFQRVNSHLARQLGLPTPQASQERYARSAFQDHGKRRAHKRREPSISNGNASTAVELVEDPSQVTFPTRKEQPVGNLPSVDFLGVQPTAATSQAQQLAQTQPSDGGTVEHANSFLQLSTNQPELPSSRFGHVANSVNGNQEQPQQPSTTANSFGNVLEQRSPSSSSEENS